MCLSRLGARVRTACDPLKPAYLCQMSQSGSPAPPGVGRGVIGYTTEMTRREWTTTEHLHDSGAFESVQLTVVSGPAVEESEAGARWLGMAYWRSVTDVTRGAVRATWSAQGGRLRLLGGPALLRFGSRCSATTVGWSRVGTPSRVGSSPFGRAALSRSSSAAAETSTSSASTSRATGRGSRRRPDGRRGRASSMHVDSSRFMPP